MVYRFEFDARVFGDLEFERSAYGLIQDGLSQLREAVADWNRLAQQQGAKALPYAEEQARLESMIEFGLAKLAEPRYRVLINGISIGSLKFLRAGLELIIRRRRSEMQKNRREGWPSGALQSIEASLGELQKLVGTLDVEPAEILWEVLPLKTGKRLSCK